jgi:isoleucyl-tRNA synthetase
MVLSTALFDKPAFQNLICNGLVLAEDGKKMSKRLNNYPPPTDIIDEYGAVSEFGLFICQSTSVMRFVLLIAGSIRVHVTGC